MAHTFTSLRYAVERLREAEHFLARLVSSDGLEFKFELNAFLSASRSVTFVMQKSLAHVSGFGDWYSVRSNEMKADPAMRFFLELRNISQKQGPVSYIGGSTLNVGWTYRFVSHKVTVPSELVGRDIAECCGNHLQKLAQLVMHCYQDFPFASCPGRAFTEEGMAALGYNFSDIESTSGLPDGYTQVGGDKFSIADKLHVLSREIDPLEVSEIERLCAGAFSSSGIAIQFYKGTGRDLCDDIVAQLFNTKADNNPQAMFLTAIMKRIRDIGDTNE